QRLAGDLPRGVLVARLDEAPGPQKAADVVGAEGRRLGHRRASWCFPPACAIVYTTWGRRRGNLDRSRVVSSAAFPQHCECPLRRRHLTGVPLGPPGAQGPRRGGWAGTGSPPPVTTKGALAWPG